MKILIDKMDDYDKQIFLTRRSAHQNFKVAVDAMAAAGILTVNYRASSGGGLSSVSKDADWTYTCDPEFVQDPQVPFEAVSYDVGGNLARTAEMMSLRRHLHHLAIQVLNAKVPDWDAAGGATVEITQDKGISIAYATKPVLSRLDGSAVFHAPDPVAPFSDATPLLETDAGVWVEIDTIDKAYAIGALGKTAVGHIYRASTRFDERKDVRWLALLTIENGEVLAAVTMAARPAENSNLAEWPYRSHVTGYANKPAYEDYVAAIDAIATQEVLRVEPNHMGDPLPISDSDLETSSMFKP